MRQFIERWYGEDGVALDVYFDPALARFDVVAGELVVFSHAAFVEILRWCMRDDAPSDDVPALGVEVSPWDPPED